MVGLHLAQGDGTSKKWGFYSRFLGVRLDVGRDFLIKGAGSGSRIMWFSWRGGAGWNPALHPAGSIGAW